MKDLSEAQHRYLRNVHNGTNTASHCRTRSDWGGLESTRLSLMRRGLVLPGGHGKVERLSDAGVAALTPNAHVELLHD